MTRAKQPAPQPKQLGQTVHGHQEDSGIVARRLEALIDVLFGPEGHESEYRPYLDQIAPRPTMHLETPLPPARPWTAIPSPEPEIGGGPLNGRTGFSDRPATYRDPAPPVEVASPPPRKDNLSLTCAFVSATTAGMALQRQDWMGLVLFSGATVFWLWAWRLRCAELGAKDGAP